jgi:hypothetical protein
MTALTSILNTDKFPLSDPLFQNQCKAELASHGAVVLPNFLTSPALESIKADGVNCADLAFFTKDQHNVYLQPKDANFSDNHPRNKLVNSSKGCITTDQIPETSYLVTLYENAVFTRFLCEVLEIENLYPYADKLSSINLHYAGDGQELGWHYDNSSFAITLLIKTPDAGGIFEYHKDLRNADIGEMNYPQTASVLAGEVSATELAITEGALVLFRGRNSLHRVTPTVGKTTRMLAVLAYNTKPDVSLSESARMTFYGRID